MSISHALSLTALIYSASPSAATAAPAPAKAKAQAATALDKVADAARQTAETAETAAAENVTQALTPIIKELEDLEKTGKDDLAEKDKQVKAAEDAKEKAETEIASIRSGKLIQYGITAGIGPVMHTPLYRNPTPAIGVMPYIMLHPAYWGSRPQQNRYCANIWAGKQSHAAASKAVDGDARERAQRRAESLYAAIRIDPNLDFAQLAAASPRNGVEIRVHGLLRDLRTVAAIPQNPETMGGLSALERAKVRKARYDHTAKSVLAVGFADVAKCGPEKSGLRDSLCSMGNLSQNLDEMLAIAVATRLVKSLEVELRSSKRRRKMADELEDRADDVLLLRPTSLKQLDEKLREPAFVRFTSANTGRDDLAGITQADLDRAKEIVKARDAGQDKISVNGQNISLSTMEEALVSELQVHAIHWMSDVPGDCRKHRFFGLWLGYPLKYKTTVPTQLGNMPILRKHLEVTEIIAAGYGISPNAYISILLGFSVGLTNIPPGDRDREVVWSFVLGLGGNLDILTLLRG